VLLKYSTSNSEVAQEEFEWVPVL